MESAQTQIPEGQEVPGSNPSSPTAEVAAWGRGVAFAPSDRRWIRKPPNLASRSINTQ